MLLAAAGRMPGLTGQQRRFGKWKRISLWKNADAAQARGSIEADVVTEREKRGFTEAVGKGQQVNDRRDKLLKSR